MRADPPFTMGLPMWSMDMWKGSLFTRDATPASYLQEYASVFQTVEGNNTFYGLPKEETLLKWKEQVPEGFRFCFKFPRSVSHEFMLRGEGALNATWHFLELMESLEDRLGLLFLQLPPGFSGAMLPELKKFLKMLPQGFDYCVEARHPDYFDGEHVEKAFLELLVTTGMNRALFDTGELHGLTVRNHDVLEAQRKKPQYPERFDATGIQPFLRYVGHEEVGPNISRIELLTKHVVRWIGEGRRPFLFAHSPGDRLAPEIARCWYQVLRSALGSPESIPALPNFPGESEPPPQKQLDLF